MLALLFIWSPFVAVAMRQRSVTPRWCYRTDSLLEVAVVTMAKEITTHSYCCRCACDRRRVGRGRGRRVSSSILCDVCDRHVVSVEVS